MTSDNTDQYTTKKYDTNTTTPTKIQQHRSKYNTTNYFGCIKIQLKNKIQIQQHRSKYNQYNKNPAAVKMKIMKKKKTLVTVQFIHTATRLLGACR